MTFSSKRFYLAAKNATYVKSFVQQNSPLTLSVNTTEECSNYYKLFKCHSYILTATVPNN